MKINIDLSNTELSHALSIFKQTAQEVVELRTALTSKTDELWKLKDEKALAERDRNYLKGEHDYLASECRRLRNENDRLSRTAGGTINYDAIPNHSVPEMGNILALVRRASTDPDAKFLIALISAAQQGAKIQMIKAVRTSTNVGLKEAKDLVEALAFGERYAGALYSETVRDTIESHKGE